MSLRSTCDEAKKSFELAKAHSVQGVASLSENGKKRIESKFAWAWANCNKMCNVPGIPNFATTEQVLRNQVWVMNKADY